MTTLNSAKYVRFFSDAHLDFEVTKKTKNIDTLWKPEKLNTDLDTVLILAGDIWHAKKPFQFMNQSWMKEVAKQFKYVLFVLGNHDYWSGNISLEKEKVNQYIKDLSLDNVFLLQNDTVLIGDYKFIGSTLWTDYLNGNKHAVLLAEKEMNDFKYIKFGNHYGKLHGHNVLNEHNIAKKYIFEQAKRDYPEQKIWVITHHPPSFNSIVEDFDKTKIELTHGSLASDLESEIMGKNIDIWIHGHTHNPSDYYIGKTRILSNPKGYPKEELEYDSVALINLY